MVSLSVCNQRELPNMSKLIIQKFILAKSVISIISWLFLMMTLVILGSLFYFLNSIDKLAATNIEERMHLALQIESKHRKDLLKDYTYWDESYKNIILKKDTRWIENNTGGFLLNNYDFDFSLGIKNGNKLVYLEKTQKAQALNFNEMMQQGLSELIKKSQTQKTITKLVCGFLSVNKDIYFVVGGPIIDEETDLPRANTFLALGTKMDRSFVRMLASNYQLFGLKLSNDIKNQPNHMVLNSPLSKAIGTFSWQPTEPSKEIIPFIALLFVIFAVITILVTHHILKRDQVNREKYEDKLFYEATRDSLTKIYNRKYFMDMGEKEFHLYERQGRRFSVLILDLDYFKKINDRFGHAIGDMALIHFTKLCHQGLRNSDILGRIGGEEFGIILPDTNIEEAIQIANRIRLLVMENPLKHNEQTIEMTVSIGVTELNQQEDFNTLLAQADKALYQVKGKGRNQVLLYNKKVV